MPSSLFKPLHNERPANAFARDEAANARWHASCTPGSTMKDSTRTSRFAPVALVPVCARTGVLAFCCTVAACGVPTTEEASRSEAELVTSCTPGVTNVYSFVGDRTFEQCTLIAKEDLLIRGSLTLRAGATLIVRPLDRRTVDNTWINVAGAYLPGGHELTVEGSLIAEGTASRPITIKASTPWVGVRVTGGDSRLTHVYIDGAELGIELEGAHNTVQHLRTTGALFGLRITSAMPLDETVENYSGGAVFLGGAGRAKVSNVRIDLRDQRSVSGLSFNGVDGVVDDAIVLGNKKGRDNAGIGASGAAPANLFISRAFVSGFAVGVMQYSETTELEITDTTLVDNVQGVRTEAAVPDRPECQDAVQAGFAPAPIAKDPRIVRSDIVRNEIGVLHMMPTILSIEDTNITNNERSGVYIGGLTLHTDSKIHRSNVYANGDVQVFSQHVSGKIDLSGNYWGVPEAQAFEFAPVQGYHCPLIPRGTYVCTGVEASTLASAGVQTSTLPADIVAARAAVALP